MAESFAQSELEAYLDEALRADEMARIEKALRRSPQLREQLAEILARRDSGLHSLGAIWRQARLSCLSREELGGYLLGTVPEALACYVEFHIKTVGCRYCEANLADLRNRQAEADEVVTTRRRRYFQSSVGHLRRGR